MTPAYQRGNSSVFCGDCLSVLPTLPAKSVHCCITSPPYFQLRDYQVDGQIGLEETVDEYVAKMVQVFGEVHRILRDDGTTWLVIGDSYNSTDKWGGGGKNTGKHTVADDGSVPSWESVRRRRKAMNGIKPKDLVGIPWAVAFSLRDAGWYLRSDIVWEKPSPMPESVQDRCTKSHEYIFMLTKQQRYFFDTEAIKETSVRPGDVQQFGKRLVGQGDFEPTDPRYRNGAEQWGRTIEGSQTRNKRSVWTIASQGYKGAHFACFPPALIEPCILAGTSQHGACAACGSPWRRVTSKNRKATRPGRDTKLNGQAAETIGNRDPQRHCTVTQTLGWEPSCKCGTQEVAPCIVLDPFAGSGTTGYVAAQHGRGFLGIELNPAYVDLCRQRIDEAFDKTMLFESVEKECQPELFREET